MPYSKVATLRLDHLRESLFRCIALGNRTAINMVCVFWEYLYAQANRFMNEQICIVRELRNIQVRDIINFHVLILIIFVSGSHILYRLRGKMSTSIYTHLFGCVCIRHCRAVSTVCLFFCLDFKRFSMF